VLQHVAACYSVLQCVAVCCSVDSFNMLLSQQLNSTKLLHCIGTLVSVCCSVVQRGALCCSVVQCGVVCGSVLQCVAVCCSVLQCIAMCCSVSCICVCVYVHMHA